MSLEGACCETVELPVGRLINLANETFKHQFNEFMMSVGVATLASIPKGASNRLSAAAVGIAAQKLFPKALQS